MQASLSEADEVEAAVQASLQDQRSEVRSAVVLPPTLSAESVDSELGGGYEPYAYGVGLDPTRQRRGSDVSVADYVMTDVGGVSSCAICLAPPDNSGRRRAVTTPCGHQFCYACLGDALRVKMECPLCRTDLSTWTQSHSGST